MAQVFILETVTNLTVDSSFGTDIQNYWGTTDPPLIFLIHFSEISHLLKDGGYMGVRVIDIEDPKEVRVSWLPFSKSQEGEYRAKDTNDYFFFLRDSAIDIILKKTGVTDEKKVLMLRLLKNNTSGISALFSLGVLSEEGGIGTGSPSAGAKIPPNQ
jgi:hypothetical protein